MASKAAIFNKALTLLGQEPISDPDGTDVGSTACRQVYDICRKALLEQHPWNFALKRIALDQETEAPAFEYDYAYGIPTDCLRIFRVYNAQSAHKEEGGLILSNDTTMKLLYVRNIEDTSQFSPLFTQLLALDLAIACEYKITNGQSLQPVLQGKRNELMVKAKLIDAQKDTTTTRLKNKGIDSMEFEYGDI